MEGAWRARGGRVESEELRHERIEAHLRWATSRADLGEEHLPSEGGSRCHGSGIRLASRLPATRPSSASKHRKSTASSSRALGDTS